MQDSVNPYAPPKSNLTFVEEQEESFAGAVLADRGTRLAGALLDGLIYFAAMIPGILIMVASAESSGGEGGMVVMFLGMAAVGIYNAYLVSTTGQSIAKRLLKMRIVRLDGSPCGFVHGVLLRAWLLGMIGQIPVLGALVSLADPLVIFGEERRCLHDYLAGTKVITVEAGA